jgi:bifunctional oligoribonuclease and PAP phosphatase NrnA
MALNTEQQIQEQLSKSQAVLIALPERASTDALVSAFALQSELLKRGKKADICACHFSAPAKLKFISDFRGVLTTIPPLEKCVISIDKRVHPVTDISYTVSDEVLRVFLTPKNGTLPKDAVQINSRGYLYDLIVTINTLEMVSLGDIYEQHKNFFFTVPIINIDHRPDNEQFGQINWVDIKATSTSEMMYHWLYREQAPEKNIATALLAGMMEETHSFRSIQVNPRTLETVSKLIAAGAEYQDVTNNLYRMKTVGSLKLWGHILNHLQADRTLSLAWSTVPASVFTATGTNMTQLQDLMAEVLNHTPEAKTVILFVEHANGGRVEIQVSTTAPLHAKDLIKDWQPHGSERFASAQIHNMPLHEAEQIVIDAIKRRLMHVLIK